ncbi:MAG: TetR/AcrR family transcriptional regulator [Proteobacteria bacterium]|nr:TetR/AcrR family transcriptional regulator [Pseudomonadota bacterium]
MIDAPEPDAAPETVQGRSKVEARRQQILDAACDCVRRSGFHGASMAEIAQAAGLSVGQIYRYFENKEAIVAAIVGQDLAEMRAKFAEFETAGGSMVATAIESCGDAVERNYDPARAALVLEVLAEAARNPKVARIVREADAVERTLGRRLLDQVRPAQGRSEAETAARGEVLSMLFDGMAMRAVNNPDGDRSEIGRVLKAVMAFLLSDQPLSPAASA